MKSYKTQSNKPKKEIKVKEVSKSLFKSLVHKWLFGIKSIITYFGKKALIGGALVYVFIIATNGNEVESGIGDLVDKVGLFKMIASYFGALLVSVIVHFQAMIIVGYVGYFANKKEYKKKEK